jgi:hypothetical protein
VEARLDQVARELGRAREDSGDARTLAAGADRESAETRQVLRSQVSLIQALRDTQLEQGRALDEHGRVLGALVAETANNSTRLDQLEAGQQQIAELLAQVLHRLPEPPAATD